MKKSHPHTALSDKRCNYPVGVYKGKQIECRKRLKQRLVETREPHNITKCYKHHQLIRGR